MGDAAKVIDWNGTDFPPELAALPPGRYRVELVEACAVCDGEAFDLTPEEEEGILAGMRSLDAGRGVPLAEVDARLRRIIEAARAR